MEDIYRVFQYHGAEHKTIFCYENEQRLTIENVKKQIAITREEKKVKSAASVTRSRKTKKGQPVNDNPESAQ